MERKLRCSTFIIDCKKIVESVLISVLALDYDSSESLPGFRAGILICSFVLLRGSSSTSSTCRQLKCRQRKCF